MYHERVTELIGKLTLQEKIGFLSGHQLAVERLGIKERFIGTEYARGWSSHDETQYCTVLPQTIGMASTFDKKLIHEAGKVAGRESRAYYNSVNKSLFGFGPTVDLERDIRWGRHEEGYGEDPFLTSEMATSYTLGIVGEGEIKQALPLLKHFVCNNTETRRDRYDAVVPEKLLQEYYYEVFRKPICEGGAFGVMTAYNKLNGHPGLVSPVNKPLIKDKWGGRLIVSDGGAFSQIMTSHGLTASHAETIALALKAGANIMLDSVEMVSAAANEAIEKGILDEATIDKAIYDTLTLRFMLGEFDETDPYANITMDMVNTEEDKKLALKMSEEQFVMLENNGLLPVSDNIKTIAVVGPQADENFLDWYTGASSYDITVCEGIAKRFKNSKVLCDNGRDHVKIKNLSTGKYLTVDAEGNTSATADKKNAEIFEKYDWGFGYVNFKASNGKMLSEDNGVYKSTAKDAYMWFVRPIMTPESAFGGVTFKGWNRNSIKLDENNQLYLSEDEHTEKDAFEIELVSSGDERALELTKNADLAICCVGNHPVQVGREGYDRDSIMLPERQQRLALQTARSNKNSILLIVSSYPFAIDSLKDEYASVLYTTHTGPELGRATANIFTGDANPSGRTACTWYKESFEFPSIFEYDIEKSKMTYLYLEEKPLYPFGYGMTYSEFEYSEMEMDNDNKKLSFTLKNISNTDGAEICQLYFNKKDSAYTRPLKKLCAFERVSLKAGEEKKVTLTIDMHSLEVYDIDKKDFVLETGEYEIYLGKNCDEIVATFRAAV